MLRTLRNRLILSHMLPLLIIVPLMGIVLIYVLETQFLIPSLTRNLTDDATLIAALARDHQEIWENPAFARKLLNGLDTDRAEQIVLFDRNGLPIAATRPELSQGADLQIDQDTLAQLTRGQIVSRQIYQRQYRDEIIEVLARWFRKWAGQWDCRLSYRYDTFYQSFSACAT
jgi:hypothetical protein